MVIIRMRVVTGVKVMIRVKVGVGALGLCSQFTSVVLITDKKKRYKKLISDWSNVHIA